MVWWQVWRRSDDSATVSNSGASPDTSGRVDDAPLAETAPPGDPTSTIHRVPDGEATVAVAQPREPQGWRLLPRPELLSHKAMPVTANMAVQRSLAAHIPVPQLALTSRPLGHERRPDGPFGTVASVMRTVSALAGALLPATHVAGPDLVLRRRVAIVEGLPTEEHPAQTSRSRPSTIGAVDRSFEGSAYPVSLTSASEPGREPPPEPIALRALGATTPLLSDFTPATSLTSASSFAAPSLAGSAASSLIARTSADSGTPESASPSDMPVTARQRRVIVVRSATEPVSLSAFAASPAPASPSLVGRTADGISMPSADSAQFAPRPHSGDDVDAADESSAGPSLSAVPEIRPTVGRRVGLGMPMNALPSSAISRIPEPDPFAGWNEPEMPLAPGSSSSTGSVEGGISGVAFGTAGEDVRGLTSSGAPDSTSVRRTEDAASLGSGAAPSPQSGTRGATYLDDDGSTSAHPESNAVTALVLSDPVEHAPLLGYRRLDRSLDESLAPVSVAGTERAVTPVRVRWGTGSDATTAGTRSDGGAGPGSPINRSVDRPSDSSSRVGSGDGQRGNGRARSGSLDPLASPIVNRSTSTGPVVSGHASSAVSPQRAAETPVWSPAPPGSGGSVQPPPAGSGSAVNPGTSSTSLTPFGSSVDSFGASGSSDFLTVERSEDEPAALLRPWSDTPPRQSLLVAGSVAASGQEAGPLLRSPDSSVGQVAALPVVNVNRAAARTSSTAPMVQRESQHGAAQTSGQSNHASLPPEHGNGDAELSPTPHSNGGGESSAAGAPHAGGERAAAGAAGAAGPTSAQADMELDRLAGKLYERIRQRLRRELLDDRERAGFALDGTR